MFLINSQMSDSISGTRTQHVKDFKKQKSHQSKLEITDPNTICKLNMKSNSNLCSQWSESWIIVKWSCEQVAVSQVLVGVQLSKIILIISNQDNNLMMTRSFCIILTHFQKLWGFFSHSVCSAASCFNFFTLYITQH